MKSIITGRRVPVRALACTVALGASLLATALPAEAAAIGKVEFLYSAPEISEEGDSVTWRWSVKNTGGETVDKVVLTHKLTPQLKVSSVSEPCEVLETSIRCEYGTMKAASGKKGTLVAAIPADTSGTVQINGRVTWQQGATPTKAKAETPAEDEAPADAPAAEDAPAEDA